MKLHQILLELKQEIDFNFQGYGSWINPFTKQVLVVKDKYGHTQIAKKIIGEDIPQDISIYGLMFDAGYVRVVHPGHFHTAGTLAIAGSKRALQQLFVNNPNIKNYVEEIFIDIEQCPHGRCQQLASDTFNTSYEWSKLMSFLR